MDVLSPGANGHTTSSDQSTVLDPHVVVRHLADLLEITLGASLEDLEKPGSLLSESKRHETVQRCTRFASDPQVALYVFKDAILPNHSNTMHMVLGKAFQKVWAR